MKSLLKFALIFIFIALSTNLHSQTRIACLPFQNMDGLMRLNILCYTLQDSVATALKEQDPGEKYFYIVPKDSIEQVLSELSLDPNSPQYASDLWKAVRKLNVEKVVMGNFNIEASRILISAYVYNARTKLRIPDYQATDIFKSEDKVMEAVPVIIKSLLPALKPKN